MFTIGRSLTVVCVLLTATATASAQSSTRYEPVEQYIGDMNPLSTSLRRLNIGIARPTGFQDVFMVPGEPGKLMRVHGSVQAVFPQSLYGLNDDDEIEAVIPPNTVFRIGPRVWNGSSTHSLLEGHPGLVSAQPDAAANGEPHPHRIVAEGFGRAAVLPRPRQRTITTTREGRPVMANDERPKKDAVEEPVSLDAPGTIIGDEQYRRERLRELMRLAAAGE